MIEVWFVYVGAVSALWVLVVRACAHFCNRYYNMTEVGRI